MIKAVPVKYIGYLKILFLGGLGFLFPKIIKGRVVGGNC